MRRLFAVIRTKGQAWDPAKSMRSQQQWSEHAILMDSLAADGIVVLGGPLDESGDILLAIKATDESEVKSILQRDPWSKLGILEVKSIQAWSILLESPRSDVSCITKESSHAEIRN